MTRFKIGQTVICVKKPERSSYQCKVGDIYTVKRLNRADNKAQACFWPTEYKYTPSECFNEGGFEAYNVIDVKEIYNSF